LKSIFSLGNKLAMSTGGPSKTTPLNLRGMSGLIFRKSCRSLSVRHAADGVATSCRRSPGDCKGDVDRRKDNRSRGSGDCFGQTAFGDENVNERLSRSLSKVGMSNSWKKNWGQIRLG
jgi:hypothetical protein